MSGEFWVGLVLGGLAGLAIDLLKRPLDRLLDRRLSLRTSTRVEKLAASARLNSTSLRNYLVEVILQTTLVGSLVAILAGIVFGLNSALSYLVRDFQSVRILLGILSVAGQTLSIVGALYIVRIASDALSLARKLNPLGQVPKGN